MTPGRAPAACELGLPLPPCLSACWDAGGSKFSQSLSKQLCFIRKGAQICSFFPGHIWTIPRYSPFSIQPAPDGSRGRGHEARNIQIPLLLPQCQQPPTTHQPGGTIHPTSAPHAPKAAFQILISSSNYGFSNLGASKVDWQGFDTENP